jgi:hypothetical protein
MKKIFVFLFFAGVATLSAQPSFTEADLPAVGYQAQFISDSSSGKIVDLGKTGGPKTWDFSKEVFGDTVVFEVLSPANTDWDTLFPKSEFVYHTSGPISDTISGDMWEYLRTTSAYVRLLGGIAVYDTITLHGKCNPEQIYATLPLQMGSKWSDSIVLSDTFSTDPAPLVLEIRRFETNEVDAWGTVTVPLGSYSSLRVRTYDTTYISLTLATIPFMADTSMTINYKWLAKDVGGVMTVGSYDGEQNPEFQEAATYIPLVKNNKSGAVLETPASTSGTLSVIGNKVLFETGIAGHVKIAVYDVLGRSMGTIYEGTPAAGKTVVTMPEGMTRGVYFVKMRTQKENMTVKAILLN